MKKLSLWCILVAIAVIPATAQKKSSGHDALKAPSVVQQAFTQNFVNISQETWHKMASGNWYADFSQNDLPSKAEYTADGQWVATRTALTGMQLPDTVTHAIQQKFPGATVNQATRIQRADVAPYYQVVLEVAGTEKDILANDKGTITE